MTDIAFSTTCILSLGQKKKKKKIENSGPVR